MASDIVSLVESIPERQSATITLVDKFGDRRQLTCIYNRSVAPSFFLLFAPGVIPENFEKSWRCIFVGKDALGESISFAAKIVDLRNNRVMELVAQTTIRPEDLREYFRVSLQAPIEVFYDPAISGDNEQPFELLGEIVDLSQSGVLSILSGECKGSKKVTIELDLPNPAQTVICSARMVRCKRIRKNRWLTAFHFEDMTPRAREIVAKNCFAEQRRQLRENIQTA